MLRAYGFRIAMFALVGLLVGLVVSLVMPKKYEAVTQILVDPHQQQAIPPNSPADASVQDLIESTAPRTVQTQVEQLTSFGVLSTAADHVAASRGVSADSIPEFSVPNLQKAVTVEAATDSDLITLRVRMSKPDLARDLASEIFLAFDAQNQDKSKEVGRQAITYLESQTSGINKQLAALDNEAKDLRQKFNAPDIALQTQADIEALKNAQAQMDAARIEEDGSRSRAAVLEQQLAGVPKSVQSVTATAPNPNYQRLEADLASARTDLAAALVQYQDDAPVVRELKARVNRLQAEIAPSKRYINSGAQQSPNPVYQSLVTEIAQAKSMAAAAHERYATAKGVADLRQEEMRQLPEVQRRLASITRQQETLGRVSLDYSSRLASLQASQRGRMTTASIVSPAFAFPNPVSPNLPLNLSAGFIAGLLLGLLSAFSTESRRSPIRNLSQLNRLTLEPAFRTIPELPFVPLGSNRQPDEVFMTLLGNFIRSAKRPYRLGVMGVDPESGATVAATSMALGAALDGHPTLLVDTAKENGAARRLGVSENETLVHVNANLALLRTGGEETASPNALIDRIRTLEETHELTIIDLHPFKSSTNPVLFLSGLDECVLMVRAGRTRTVDFLQAQQMLIDAGVPQVTVVLTRARAMDDDFSFLPAEPPAQALMTR